MKQALSSILTLSALIPLGCDPSPEPNLGELARAESAPDVVRDTIVDPSLARHAFSSDAAGGFVAADSDTVRVDAEGLAVRLGQDTLRLTLQSWGRPDAHRRVEPARPRLGACAAGVQTAATECARRVEQSHGSLTAWVARREGAVEQGWTLAERPAGAGPVELRLAVTGGELVAVERDAAVLATRGVKWRYSGLKAWDADGKDLPAHLERSPRGLGVVVDDTDARYPVEIDPSLVTTEVKLTPLNPQGYMWSEKYNYGAAIRDIGDLNGDGYDDVAVGAPHDVSMLGSSGCRGAGRVYLYFGTPMGIDPQSEKILDPIADGSYASWKYFPSFPAGNGCPMTRFGADIAAGEVDGYGKRELYIGAPGAMFDVNGSPDYDVGRVWNYSDAGVFGDTPGVPMFLDSSQCSAFEKIGTSVDVKNGPKGVLAIVASPSSAWGQQLAQLFGQLWEGWLDEHCAAASWAGNAEYERFGHRARIIGAKGMKIAIAAPLHGGGSEGRVHVAGLNESPPMNGTNISLYNPDPIAGGRFGWDLDDAGDVNGDKHADLIVGAPGNKGSGEASGLAYLYLSTPSTPYFHTDDFQPVLPGGVKPHDEFGAVAGVGDLDGDGFDDLLFGAPGADNGMPESGLAYVVFGSSTGANIGGAVTLAPSDVKPYDFFGHRVSAAGDVDGNGRPDLMVSACEKYKEELGDDNNMFGWCSGAVYVFNSL